MTALTAQQAAELQATAERLLFRCKTVAASIRSKANREHFEALVDNARINADDTVYVERANDDWESIFRSTFESELCFFGGRFHGTVGQLRATVRQLRAHFARI